MLDYTTHEKKALSVKLINGKTVLLTAPKKSLYEKLTAIGSELKDEQVDGQLYDSILQLTAEILSSNKTGAKFTAADVDEIMDIEDMALLIFEYSKFAGQLIGNPN